MTTHMRANDPPEGARLARARARYELLRLLLGVLLVLIVLSSLVLGLLQGRRITQLAEDNRRSIDAAQAQSELVADILARQKEADAKRAGVIDAAIVEIDRRQTEALALHDARALDGLRRALGLLEEEVNAPANKEDLIPPAVVMQAPAAAPPAPAPRVPRAPVPRVFQAPAPAPATAPAPAPPPPCETRGNSDRCR